MRERERYIQQSVGGHGNVKGRGRPMRAGENELRVGCSKDITCRCRVCFSPHPANCDLVENNHFRKLTINVGALFCLAWASYAWDEFPRLICVTSHVISHVIVIVPAALRWHSIINAPPLLYRISP